MKFITVHFSNTRGNKYVKFLVIKNMYFAQYQIQSKDLLLTSYFSDYYLAHSLEKYYKMQSLKALQKKTKVNAYSLFNNHKEYLFENTLKAFQDGVPLNV